MSYCRDEENGKDKVVFLTEEDNDELLQQSSAVLEADDGVEEVDPDDQRTAIGPDGEIDWDCPCLKGMAHGTCGQEFRDAFSCFAKSEAEPKGMDCVDAFELMQGCIKAHPEEYGQYDRDNDDDDLDEQVGAEGAAAPSTETKAEETPVESKQ
ncbi:hypothetical protein SARC_04142 [Sphaeroforma arctica JP610]|uniref:CHCH domain-containing protein n=1 Tax=Sphaeroforma arctica JP610 TaxID=667725 RepID=A0A0L0G3C6_9EUKA|nr:hypothetical protein SARC_04142 [Sphaeroforma arctica JP610]KNC83607.1 hypothetical protein SARC_04142 [Sphaeroforma arctica JP610]|eukprot:XP_014157509.1 hypothetical protein SARC_04142 [Sphaeroforma arctica JP610]